MIAPPEEHRLRSIAGTVWARAEDLFRRGRVITVAQTPQGVTGTVLGGQLYRTTVSVANGRLAIQCTCPMGTFCKHGFAMALRWTRDAANGRLPEPPRPAEPVRIPTPDEVIAWMRAHRVEHAVGFLAYELEPYLDDPHHRYTLQHFTAMPFVELASGARRLPPQLVEPFARAARLRLEIEARDVAAGIAEEATRPATPPRDEVAPLWKRLLALRAEQRATAVPRGRDRRRAGEWSFDPHGLELGWQEADAGLPLGTSLAFRDGAAVLTCACDAADACTHRLALIDATLDVLADPARVAIANEASKQLMRPGWARVLESLERAGVASEPRVVEVWWLVDLADGLAITPLVRKQTKRGAWSAGARVKAERLVADYPELDPRDRAVAEALATFERVREPHPMRALAALVGHPRVRIGDDLIAVRHATLGLRAERTGDAIRIEATIDGAPLTQRGLATLLDGAFGQRQTFLFTGDVLLVIEPAAEVRDVCRTLLVHGAEFPPEAHEPLLDAITRLDGRVSVAVTDDLLGVAHPLEPTLVARVRFVATEDRVELELEPLIRPAPNAPLVVPGSGRRDVMVMRDGVRGYVRRRLDDELAFMTEQLGKLGTFDTTLARITIADVDEALDVVTALGDPPRGIEAEWVDTRPRLLKRFGVKALRVKIDRESDWFDARGEVVVDGDRLQLAVMLDALRRQQRYVRVGAASWVELGDEVRARLAPIADHAFVAGDRVELSLGAMPAVDALRDAGAKVSAAPEWTLQAKRLAAARELEPVVPAALRKVVRPYQADGFAWLTRVAAWGAGACLADDMGLGKTLQAIAVLQDRAELGPAFVVAPTSVTTNWVRELARFAPKLRPLLLAEAGDRAATIAGAGKRDVVIASYGVLVREIDALATRPFATLVLDEAQLVKNAVTRRAKAASRLQAELRIALTGTPLENHLGELWSIFSIVFPGLLGSWERFRERFAKPIEDGDPAAREALARVLRPFLLRRTKGEVARELPARTEIPVPIELSADELELYEDARLAAVAHLNNKVARDEQRRFQVLAALTRMRQLACHPKLYDPSSAVPSSKLRRLLELVDELRAGGHRALVFSQFTGHLALVCAELDRAGVIYQYLDGGTPAAERARRIDAFQAGAGELFLISLKAGGTGINLTAADYVIHLDPWWNPAVEDQATDRAHRIGQTKPVTVYRLIAKGTVEDKIVAMHGRKRELVAQVLDGTGGAAKLSTADLLALLT